MSLIRRSSLLRFLLPAVFIAVAQLVLAPASAQASCGDYVMVGGHGMMNRQGGHRDEASAAQTPVRQRHCSGPQCSGETPRPFGAPSVPPKIVARHWGLLDTPVPMAAADSRFSHVEDDTGDACLVVSSVYRPPR